jgi:hypothetical protein
MRSAAIVFAAVLPVAAIAGCTPAEREAPRTPLPTRQTTIAPVEKKLDAAARDADRRREDIDNAAK